MQRQIYIGLLSLLSVTMFACQGQKGSSSHTEATGSQPIGASPIITPNQQEPNFYREQQLAVFEPAIREAYARCQSAKMRSKHGQEVDVAYLRCFNPLYKQTIVFSVGHSESHLKYDELVYDLFHILGYNLYITDHRGQGLSTHLLHERPWLAHVERYDHYVDDLDQLVQEIVIPETPGQKLYLVAHSMGGGIAARYLETKASPFLKVVLASPMLNLKTGVIPEWLVRRLVGGLSRLGLAEQSTEVPILFPRDSAKKSWIDRPYENTNRLTSSQLRFERSRQAFAAHKDAVIDATTLGWIAQSGRATAAIHRDAHKISTPLYLFSVPGDAFVEPSGHKDFCIKAQACTLDIIPAKWQSQHELFQEKDLSRAYTLSRLHEFFQSN